ncbi:Biotin-requiring enzyme [Paenacidovorax caeni]|uniref:Biotin-requiring enzyme n=1 Tax=Paenacidovorax caeni TaxID=343013 RepID=A0A1I7JEB6_9BURK|nr:Biotin-requiring enzyme [Paenacidovorax caeni]
MALVDIKIPDIGGLDEVGVIELLVKPGDTVKAEQSLITVESDKASMEIPSCHAGVIKELCIALGDKVSEGSVIAVLETVGAGSLEPKQAPAPAAQAPEAPKTEAPTARPAGWPFPIGDFKDVANSANPPCLIGESACARPQRGTCPKCGLDVEIAFPTIEDRDAALEAARVRYAAAQRDEEARKQAEKERQRPEGNKTGQLAQTGEFSVQPPGSENAGKAAQHLDKLQKKQAEESAWQLAKDGGVKLLEAFLLQYPESDHAKEAERLLRRSRRKPGPVEAFLMVAGIILALFTVPRTQWTMAYEGLKGNWKQFYLSSDYDLLVLGLLIFIAMALVIVIALAIKLLRGKK